MATDRTVWLAPAARTTPTLWSRMRVCKLWAALSSCREAENWVLHSPRAWLGSAFHRVMEKAPSDRSEVEDLWDAAIREILVSASNHHLDSRFANTERWPGYYLARQRAIASAMQRSRQGNPGLRLSRPPVQTYGGSEKLLTARAGFLAGRPDHFDLKSVTEYKSALPDPAWPEAASILDGYWRQLSLYAVLIAEIGTWPATARILSASGDVLEKAINKDECEAEADAAISGLDAMNKAIKGGCDSAALASPGPITCGQCPYQAICPAFWSWCEAASWPELREPAARGTLEALDPGMDGDLYAIMLHLEGRYGIGGVQSIALRKSVHGDLTDCAVGSSIKIVFATVRRDGRLRADISTCVFREDDLPVLRCGSAS